MRLSKQTREQIATLKRRTGIRHMNVLCRWALCRSLSEPSDPSVQSSDTATEIEWDVFAGAGGRLWWSLLLEAGWSRGVNPSSSEADALLRAHIARGMSYLVGDPAIKDVTSLARLALAPM
ncbi:DNA sulfur modification protein DndE [Blastococcus sp. SYSU D01042]